MARPKRPPPWIFFAQNVSLTNRRIDEEIDSV
jgi:hypothetical protein